MSRRIGLLGLVVGSLIAKSASAEPQGLVVKMGEVWIFHLENGQPTGTHLVSPDTKPAPNELMVKMTPNNGTTLVVTNNTDKFLNYHATIVGKDREEPTSVCTLMSGGRSGFENWGGRIPVIRLGDFQPAKDNMMVCR